MENSEEDEQAIIRRAMSFMGKRTSERKRQSSAENGKKGEADRRRPLCPVIRQQVSRTTKRTGNREQGTGRVCRGSAAGLSSGIAGSAQVAGATEAGQLTLSLCTRAAAVRQGEEMKREVGDVDQYCLAGLTVNLRNTDFLNWTSDERRVGGAVRRSAQRRLEDWGQMNELSEFAKAVLELGNDILQAANEGRLNTVQVLAANLCLAAALAEAVEVDDALEEGEADPYDFSALEVDLGAHEPERAEG